MNRLVVSLLPKVLVFIAALPTLAPAPGSSAPLPPTHAPAAGGAAPRRGHPHPGRVRLDRGGHARIPFELRNQHVWIRGTVNTSDSVWIVVDTGAGSSVMDEALARSLGLRPRGSHEALGAGGPQASFSVKDVTVRLPGLSIHRGSMDATALAGITGAAGRPMQVIVGYELFHSCVVRFDYAAGMMDVWDPATAPRAPPGVAVPMELEENLPYVDGELAMPGRAPIRGRFVIDTGSSLSLLIADDVVERESLVTSLPRSLEVLGRGVGGETRYRTGRADAFSLGELRFERPLVALTFAGAGRISVPGSVGNIGGRLLGRCRVTFDYPNQRVIFDRAEDFHHPFEADMSGATFVRADSALEVRIVNPDTPAAEAALRVGDRITSVDGEPVPSLDMPAFRKRLEEEGRAVRMSVWRGGETFTTAMVLRRIL